MTAELFVLTAHLPTGEVCAGIVLVNRASGAVYLRMRESWQGLAQPEDAEILKRYEETFRSAFLKVGAEPYLQMLRDSLSHVLRISDMIPVDVTDFDAELRRQGDLRGLAGSTRPGA